jgi:hypothetical protein
MRDSDTYPNSNSNTYSHCNSYCHSDANIDSYAESYTTSTSSPHPGTATIDFINEKEPRCSLCLPPLMHCAWLACVFRWTACSGVRYIEFPNVDQRAHT